ncbi:MAG: response regulator [Leptothrix ochracea]|uniref:hybrid sensor histidine kinase/response regulator n=1 Tax=Leptothrix ochracea TaxID=735331 RepID=UPI0034E19BEC
MRLRAAAAWFFAGLFGALWANAALLWRIDTAHDRMVAAHAHRAGILSLGGALQRETEQLTQLVRMYTVTGESRFLIYYYDILKIREGKAVAPAGMASATYWDEVIAHTIPHQLDNQGVKLSIQERFLRLGATEEESQALDEVLLATKAMAHIDQKAFALTQGLYDLRKGELVSEAVPRLDVARRMVNSPDYNLLKAHLAKAVARLLDLSDQRTLEEVQFATNEVRRNIQLSMALLLIELMAILLAYKLIRYGVLHPIRRLWGVASDLEQGLYNARTGPLPQAVVELQSLAITLDAMAHAVQDDLNRRQVVQQALEHARQEAESATQAKSLFLANMSHEIRTPMNAIIGMTHLALQTELHPRQRDFIAKAHGAARALLGVINDVLDFSKIEAGKITLEHRRFQLEEVLAHAFVMVRLRAQEQGIELILDPPDIRLVGPDPVLSGDPLRLGQVLTNLLGNAVKFTHRGHVRLRIEWLDELADGWLHLGFSVEDSGIGMTPEQMNALFQAFTQADRTITRQYGGTGLGLTIAKRLVEAMGGSGITVESVLGQGSCFRFDVYLQRLKVSLAPLPGGLLHPFKPPLRILVVDDHPLAQAALVGLLQAYDAGVMDTSSGGQEALAQLHKAAKDGQPYDVVMLDWRMPDMGGEALLKAIHAAENLQPAVVVVSDEDSDAMHQRVAELGCHTVLMKPVLPQAIRLLVESGMAKTTFSTPSSITPVPPPLYGLHGMRVLLVEDNPLNQELASELMASQGVDVVLARDGQEAIDFLQQVPDGDIDVVLMDLNMPVMDGYEATRRLRELPRFDALPILALTAHAMSQEHVRCLNLGMNGYLTKPIDPEALFELLRTHGRPWILADDPTPQPLPESAHGAPVRVEVALPDLADMGIDTAKGLFHADGQPDLYVRILHRFVTEAQEISEALPVHVQACDWVRVHRLAHTLKGLSGLIGAVSLAEEAHALETLAALAGEGATTQDVLKIALDGLCAHLNPVLLSLTHRLALIER